ncbi:hypothetical protein NMG60_11021475 [Bertholletia excelsa]
MEGSNDNSGTDAIKLKTVKGNISAINVQRDNRQFLIGCGRSHLPSKGSGLGPYAAINKSNLENLDSTLIRYLRSGSSASSASYDAFKLQAAADSPKHLQMIGHQYHGSNSSNSGGSSGFGSRGLSLISPLAAVENLETPPSRSPPVFRTPVKVEEDVLVMDGILVGSVPGGRIKSSASSDSSGSSSSGSNSFYKTEICRPWEDSGHCRYGSKCQFAHGKEEVRPTRFPNKNKSEAQTCKSFTGSGSCSYGAKCRFAHHHQVMAGASPTELAGAAPEKALTICPVRGENSGGSSGTSGKSVEWCPLDDSIDVAFPPTADASTNKTASREEVNSYINNVLYGPSQGKKRLPVFEEICPSSPK